MSKQPTTYATPLRSGGLRRARRAGFSIIELLVAVIIIGILVAVLVPLVSRRAEQARFARAQSDSQNLAESLERAAIDTGYYMRLFALNDVSRGDGIPFTPAGNNGDRRDGLTDYTVGQSYYGNLGGTNGLFIDIETADFALVNKANLIDRLVASESRYDQTVVWRGPYLNWQSDRNERVNNAPAPDGIPDDPWGNNYLLITRLGVVLEPNGTIQQNFNDVNGNSYNADIFDRTVVLSLGANGLPGRGPGSDFGDDDDVVYKLGR